MRRLKEQEEQKDCWWKEVEFADGRRREEEQSVDWKKEVFVGGRKLEEPEEKTGGCRKEEDDVKEE